VELLVSSGLTQVPVPNVLGLQEAEAVDRLQDAELEPKVQRVFAGAPKGIVVEQAPQSGERAASGATVTIKVSKGRNTTTTGQTTTGQTTTGGTTTGQTAPNVVGLAQTPALRQLDAGGFRGVVSYRVSNRPRGLVIEQAGTPAGPDGEVGLVVSAGPTEPEVVVVEDVRGLDEAEARERLEGAGFRVEVIRRGEGGVTDQQPEPDVSAPRGAVVTLFVG
jgi:serine/threonine-protein kinase